MDHTIIVKDGLPCHLCIVIVLDRQAKRHCFLPTFPKKNLKIAWLERKTLSQQIDLPPKS